MSVLISRNVIDAKDKPLITVTTTNGMAHIILAGVAEPVMVLEGYTVVITARTLPAPSTWQIDMTWVEGGYGHGV